jgi:AcrR family transcriptional regulator
LSSTVEEKEPMARRRSAKPPAGSLRETLVDAAAALIARQGPQGFSLREVARRARVSEAAPYWHFADREALLAAVAERGFVAMERWMLDVRAKTAGPRQRLRALGVGYVRFGLANPAYLRVMFGSEVPDKAAHPSLKGASDRTFALLVQAITDGQAAGQIRRGDPVELAVAAWSLVHGLAALLVDGKLKDHVPSARQAERLAGRVTDLFIVGLMPRRAAGSTPELLRRQRRALG